MTAITDANTPQNHRINLALMCIEYLLHNQDYSQQDHDSIMLTYRVLDNELKEMDT